MVVEPGVLQPSCAGAMRPATRGPRLRVPRPPRSRRGRYRPSSAATEYGGCARGFSTSRQCRSAWLRRSSASSNAWMDRLRRPKYSQAPRRRELADVRRSRDRLRGPRRWRSARSPRDHFAVDRSNCVLAVANRHHAASVRGRQHAEATARPPAADRSRHRTCRTGGADDEQEVVELVVVIGCSQWRLSPAPTAGLTARAGRRRRARWRRESAHR